MTLSHFFMAAAYAARENGNLLLIIRTAGLAIAQNYFIIFSIIC